MDITIKINCDNAAFEDENCGSEIGRVLLEFAHRIQNYDAKSVTLTDGLKLFDINGNKTGTVKVTR